MSWKYTLPEWKNKGTSPSNELLKNGFQGGYKPPAPLFNWYISSVIDSIKELQDKTAIAKENNLKTYTALNQIGLSGAVTMEQIFSVLPDQSTLFLANTNDTTAVNYVSDVPAQYGNIEAIRYSKDRGVAMFTKGDDSGVMHYMGKYHSASGWSGWIKMYSETSKPTPAEIGAQPLHYYYNLASIGCEASSTLTEVWEALPNNSILSYSSSDLTDASWNFPKIKGSPAYGTLLIEKHSGIRAGIYLLGKAAEYKDYRMYLDDTTGTPSGVWYQIYTSANKPTPVDIGALPISGGTLTGENLKLYNGLGRVATFPTSTFLEHCNEAGDTANFRQILVTSPKAQSSLNNALLLKHSVDGASTTYRIYGEHYKPTAADVGLGNVPNVTTNNQTPTYSDTTNLQTLASGEKLNVAFQKIKCAITNLINHLNDKNNPHGVTLSQVGAIGYRRLLTKTDDLNNITADGVYVYTTDVGTNGLKNAPFKNGSVVEVFGSTSTDTQKIQRVTRYGVHGESAWRALLDGKWSEWSRYAIANESADNAGCYYYNVNGVIEWINPPMLPGKEYRTTKRYWGNPIYVQCGFLTSLPNTNTTTFKLGEDKDVIIPIDFRVNVYDGEDENRIYPSPYFSSSGAIQCTHYKSDVRTFTIRTFADLSGCSAFYWVEYVKSF